MFDTDIELKKHRSLTLQLYIVFIISIIASCIPNTTMQLLGIVFFVALIITVPIYRYSAPDRSFLQSHMRYLNTTIWWGSTFVLIGAIIMGLWVYSAADQSMIEALKQSVMNGGLVTEDQIQQTIDDFMRVNFGLLLKSGLICVGPPALYVFVRIIKALLRIGAWERME